MKYAVSYQNPNSHYIDIQVETQSTNRSQVKLQLPAWRPGRYELANFAKNIQKWSAKDQNGNVLLSQKLSKDLWEVECKGTSKVVVDYTYFANDLNAGSTFLDEKQLYMNPVNCLLYDVDNQQAESQLVLQLPEDYKVAIALPETAKNTFVAKDFDELVDSPFIASPYLKHHSFELSGTIFHLWFQGEFKPDWDLLEKDFVGFTKPQIELFGDFPTKEFHYLFQILPHSAYHGVEHSASTVIALGPSYNVLKREGRYEDLLGVSSHELFHTWNVKRIRPIEMHPYDFSKENYSKLGYLSEGATTWYGDVMLYRGKVFDDAAFFRTFNQILDRHYNNPGSSNMSVASSSYDTWLDGYVMGVPNRKASIYTEGALITFMLDVEIRKLTKNEQSFDDVMCSFYNDYYKNGKGVSEADYKSVVEHFASKNLDVFFSDFINGSKDFSENLEQCMEYFGLEFQMTPSATFHEAYLGVRIFDNKVITVFPNSHADLAGISVGDEIVILNGFKINDDLSQWLDYFKDAPISMGAFDQHGSAKRIMVTLTEDVYYSKNEVYFVDELTEGQKKNLKAWRKY